MEEKMILDKGSSIRKAWEKEESGHFGEVGNWMGRRGLARHQSHSNVPEHWRCEGVDKHDILKGS